MKVALSKKHGNSTQLSALCIHVYTVSVCAVGKIIVMPVSTTRLFARAPLSLYAVSIFHFTFEVVLDVASVRRIDPHFLLCKKFICIAALRKGCLKLTTHINHYKRTEEVNDKAEYTANTKA